MAGCGSRLANGSWTGVMGMLQAKQIDFIGNLCMFSPSRLDANFTAVSFPAWYTKQNFMIKMPKLQYQFRFYITFDLFVWYSLVGFCVMYFITDAIFFAIILKKKVQTAFVQSLYEIFNLIFAFGGTGRIKLFSFKQLSFLMICFFAYFFALYSTSVTKALLSPVVIQQPFNGTEELLSKMKTDKYKIFNFVQTWRLTNCIGEKCEEVNDNINKYNYVRYPHEPVTKAEMHDFLDQINKHENFVLVTAKLWIDVYLQAFLDASAFWQFEDEDHQQLWYGYLVHEDFKQKNMITQALIDFGDFKTNLYEKHIRPSKSVNSGKMVKGKMAAKFVVTFSIIKWQFVSYGVGIFISIVCFLVENFMHKFRANNFDRIF